MSLVFIGCSAGLLVAARDWLWASVAVFAAMLAALTNVIRLLVRHGDDMACPRWLSRLVTINFGLRLGWSSVAVFVHVGAALAVAALSAAVLILGTAVARWVRRREHRVSGRMTAGR